jgi:pimeloyl-ACP methyl ester carboxylesterase
MATKMTLPNRASLILVLVLGALSVLVAQYFKPAPVLSDPALLVSGQTVRVVSDSRSLAFLPATASGSGLIFYPGASVPPEAYAYLGRALAEKGHTTVIARFPLNFAIFSPGRAAGIIAAHSDVATWFLGGHSLGGAMAASWIRGHREAVRGLIFLASWPGWGDDLHDWNRPVLSISATFDGLATPAKLAASRNLLPATARFVELSGGNHANFGEYGRQNGDGVSTIEGTRQRAAVVEEVLAFIGPGE